MTSETDVLAAALALEPASRERVARRLVDSLQPADADLTPLTPEWEAEIARRVTDVDSGAVVPVSADVVFDRIRRRERR